MHKINKMNLFDFVLRLNHKDDVCVDLPPLKYWFYINKIIRFGGSYDNLYQNQFKVNIDVYNFI